MNKMETCPPCTTVLLYVQGVWLEGAIRSDGSLQYYAQIDEHGCGCCSNEGEAPVGWLPLPSTDYTD